MYYLLPRVTIGGFGLFTVHTQSLRNTIAAGFDGVELHRAGIWLDRKDPTNDSIRESIELGAKITTIHQGWSLAENPTVGPNHILSALGCLPKDGYTLSDHLLPMARVLPAVVYADRAMEVVRCGHQENWWLQTVSTFDKDLNYKLPYEEFVKLVRKHKFRVVFDTQHVLEWMLNVMGVEYIGLLKNELLKRLLEAWEEIGPENVREIHLADFRPELGHTKGRNVYPGTGVLPLKEFMEIVRRSSWVGNIVPETQLKFSSVKVLEGLLRDTKRIVGG